MRTWSNTLATLLYKLPFVKPLLNTVLTIGLVLFQQLQ